MMASRMAAAALLRPVVHTNTARAHARGVSHYYGALRRHAKGSAGAKLEAPELTYMDRLRAEHILRTRMHLGHQKRKMNPAVSGAIYGFRHNVAIFDIKKTWRSLRTLFYGFAEMAQVRSSFFLLAPNPNLPLQGLIDKMRNEYPFKYNQFSSLYMTGYADKKWIDGLFSNWKVTFEYYDHMKRSAKAAPDAKKYRRYERYLRGVDGVDLMARIVPDFVLVFATDRGAIHESTNLDLPLFGMVDSNTNPTPFLYPVFGNDDSIESLGFMLDLLKRGVEEGRKREHEAFAIMMMRKLKSELDPLQASPEDEFIAGMDEPQEPLASLGPGDATWEDPDLGWVQSRLGKRGGIVDLDSARDLPEGLREDAGVTSRLGRQAVPLQRVR